MNLPLSGVEITLSSGDYTAAIATVGATLRALQHKNRDLVVPFNVDEVRPSFRGAILAPWPNRIVDGRYTFNGIDYQLSVTEPSRGHALHGLVSWLNFDIVDRHESEVTLEGVIEPQAGYPFRLRIRVIYSLNDRGLHTRVEATNLGGETAPFGTGPHPYLVAGDGRVDDWTLLLPATDVLTVTEDRLIPVEVIPVASDSGKKFDFTVARRISSTFIDHCFTSLQRDEEGITEVRLTSSSGSGVAMRWDRACPWLQIHTADLPDPKRSRMGLAVEPMTCPPDAFNSGTDLLLIEPGDSAAANWTIAAI